MGVGFEKTTRSAHVNFTPKNSQPAGPSGLVKFAPENGWLEYESRFLLGRKKFGLFSGANSLAVSFRECMILQGVKSS